MQCKEMVRRETNPKLSKGKRMGKSRRRGKGKNELTVSMEMILPRRKSRVEDCLNEGEAYDKTAVP